MKRIYLSVALIFVLFLGSAHAEIQFNGNTTVIFASPNDAKQILRTPDDFIQRLSTFDRAARMKTNRDVSEKEFLEFVGENVLSWSEIDKRSVSIALRAIQRRLAALSLSFPEKIYIIKTTGHEEGGAAYTRSNSIVLPQDKLAANTTALQRLISHELFHILTRNNPKLKERLYETIGFTKCNEIEFPAALKPRKITNPDAPINDHYIRLKIDGKESWAVPILFSSTEKYDINRGGEFFDYLQFKFLLVERNDASLTVKPLYDGQRPRVVDMQEISGFIEQVGRNTEYIIHPEEILADNFVLFMLDDNNIPSPDVLERMRAVLSKKEIAEPVAPLDRMILPRYQ